MTLLTVWLACQLDAPENDRDLDGYLSDAGDCGDDDPAVHPGSAEICNGLDDNCDGAIDEGAGDGPTLYADFDGDGFGTDRFTTTVCNPSAGWVEVSGDCSDLDALRYPGAPERCDGLDDDCDGAVDEADAVDAPTWYRDADADGFGDAGAATVTCEAPEGTVSNLSDCNDKNEDVHPDAVEACNGTDDDCDGTADDGARGVGRQADCPADSCAGSLAAQGGHADDGVYWIDPDDAGSVQVWCDMTTDGGGWTLVWKMHHVSAHGNDGPSDDGYVPCDLDPLDADNDTDECNIPNKWTSFTPTDLRIVSAAFTFEDPVDYDYVYTEPTDALDDDDNVLPYTSAAHFRVIEDNCPGSYGVPPTTDTAPGYWLDKASPGSDGNWDIDLVNGRFDANCSRLGYGGPGGYASATTFLYVR